MLLHLVRRDYGPKVANQVAQRLVIAPHREGGQAQFVPRPVAADERGRLARLLDFIRAHLPRRTRLRSLAARAAMSARTLQREFTQATGQAPYEWIVSERVERAKELLESTRLSAQAIAARVGMGSAESLRHHFRQRLGTTPVALPAALLTPRLSSMRRAGARAQAIISVVGTDAAGGLLILDGREDVVARRRTASPGRTGW